MTSKDIRLTIIETEHTLFGTNSPPDTKGSWVQYGNEFRYEKFE